MNNQELRKAIRARKRAMTPEEIERRSQALCRKFLQSEAYQRARTLYGYLPYNQEVGTVPILERALADGKRVAVPKVYGDEMKFIFLEDLTQVAVGYANIPEPIADGPVAQEPATAGASTTSSSPGSRTIPPWPCATNSRW